MMADISLHFEVSQWLFTEAALLDQRRFNDWLALLTQDIRYVVPIRVTKAAGQGTGFEDSPAHFNDSYFLLEQRVRRLETGYAWAEDPPSRTRHMVTNIQIEPTDRDDEILAKSCLLLHRTRGDIAAPEQLIGERHDRLRRVDGALRLSARTVYLDHTTLPMQNLSVLL